MRVFFLTGLYRVDYNGVFATTKPTFLKPKGPKSETMELVVEVPGDEISLGRAESIIDPTHADANDQNATLRELMVHAANVLMFESADEFIIKFKLQ